MVQNVKIKDVRMLITPNPGFVWKDASIAAVAKAMIANPDLKTVYVVDEELRLAGVVTLRTLIKYEFMDIAPRAFEYFDAIEFIGKKSAGDIMVPASYVKDEDTLMTAFSRMYENDLAELAVVDDDMRLIGNIDMLELLTMLVEKKEQKAGSKCMSLTVNRPFHKRFK